MTLQFAPLSCWWLNTNQCHGLMSEVIQKRATATRYQTAAVENLHKPAEPKRDELEMERAALPSNTNTTLPGSTNNPDLCKSQFSLTTDWTTKTLHHLQDKTTTQHELDSLQMLVLALKKKLSLHPEATMKTAGDPLDGWRLYPSTSSWSQSNKSLLLKRGIIEITTANL